MIRLKLQRELGDYVSTMRFSDDGKVLAVNMGNGCSYLLYQDGEVKKYCYGVSYDVSFLGNMFAFVTFSGVIYIISESGELINIFQIGPEFSNAIALTEEGLIVCNTQCALYTEEGKMMWSVKLKGYARPGAKSLGNKAYIIVDEGDKSKIVEISLNGEIKEVFECKESIFSMDVCDGLFAIGGTSKLWVGRNTIEGFEGVSSVTFSRNCEELMVSDMYNGRVMLMDVNGREKVEILEDGLVTAMDWNTRLAVGLNDGRVKVYEMMRRASLER